MFQVILINGTTETTIHYPSADSSSPHLLSLPFKESLSKAEELSFSIPYGNPGYNLVEGLITRVKVIDTRDDSVVFTGRVLNTKEGMISGGAYINQVTCEGAMNYLCDTHTGRWNFTNNTPFQIIEWLLSMHNSKVEDSKHIQVGTIEITQPITLDTNFETTLNVIATKLHNILGGDLRVRETAGVLYLDYLTDQGANNGVAIKIGVNAKQMIREYDPADVVTRVIPQGYGEGVNTLDITKVNGGIEYIEDATAKAKYGVIEGLVTNKDIQNADTLKIYGQTVLNEKKQPKLIIDTAMVDRSVLEQYALEKYGLGDTLHVVDFDVYARVIERDRDLILSPWEPTQVISTRPITLTDQMISLKQRNMTLEQAPQGNTCIFPIQAQENADLGNPIKLDLDIPAETININRVYVNLHGRKYRAYSKGVAAAAESSATTPTTASSAPSSSEKTFIGYDILSEVGQNVLDNHVHNVHIDGINFNHDHTTEIPGHEHTFTIPGHEHATEYGILESTFPLNTKIKVNGVDMGLNFGDGLTAFDEYNLDITSHINIGNNKIEISTEQNSRIECVLYSQIFIQSK